MLNDFWGFKNLLMGGGKLLRIMEDKNKPESKVKSIDKACKILDLISQNRNGMRLMDIAKDMDLSLSAVHHIIRTLINNKLLCKNKDTGKYCLGFKIGELGNRYYANLPFYENLMPYLKEIKDEFNETTNLIIIENSDFVLAESLSSSHSLQPIIFLNKKQIHATAWGKILLSSFADEDLDNFLKNYDFIKFTKNTIDNVDDMKVEINNIRKNNIAFDNEELENGLCCAGIPVYGYRHRLVAAVTVSIPKNRLNDEIREKLVNRMLEIFKDIQNKFGKKII